MKTVVRGCALAIGIWLSLLGPSRALHLVGGLDAVGMDDTVIAQLFMPLLFLTRLATIWVLLRLGWSVLSSCRRVRKFQPRRMPNLSNADYYGRKSWPR